jgi:hypothetical protein
VTLCFLASTVRKATVTEEAAVYIGRGEPPSEMVGTGVSLVATFRCSLVEVNTGSEFWQREGQPVIVPGRQLGCALVVVRIPSPCPARVASLIQAGRNSVKISACSSISPAYSFLLHDRTVQAGRL